MRFNPRSLSLAALAVATCTLLGGCLQPPLGMPDERTLSYDGRSVVPPDCAALRRPSLLSDAGIPRQSVSFGCATYTNLAAQIARPADIVEPVPMGPANGAVAANAVLRYQTDAVTPLDTSTSRNQTK
ncbi:CpaD family pilus assembly lipoprotein [Caballeronia sp.]|uniref:CpaD family pilus assembly lipoprotein n=1 Tax=Caballeronia sp. TaxID=1931223 RepID=UPI003C69A6A9